MFDFRYHVASLAAVFLALVIGILVGVGVSGNGLVDKSERKILQSNIERLTAELDKANADNAQLAQQQRATNTLVAQAYPALMYDRLADKKIALVVIGSDAGAAGHSVETALTDAGAGDVYRYRALKVPVDATSLSGSLVGSKQLAAYAGRGRIGAVGRELARELVHGGRAPLWNALSSQIVEERHGSDAKPVDGVVVVRAVPPQGGDTARFLYGLYEGLGAAGVPTVGVEARDTVPSAVPAFKQASLSTVDDVDEPLGRLALVLLLAGGEAGHYGVGAETAPDGLLPPVTPLTPATATSG